MYFAEKLLTLFTLLYIVCIDYISTALQLQFFIVFTEYKKIISILFGISRMDRARNEEVSRRAGIERELAS